MNSAASMPHHTEEHCLEHGTNKFNWSARPLRSLTVLLRCLLTSFVIGCVKACLSQGFVQAIGPESFVSPNGAWAKTAAHRHDLHATASMQGLKGCKEGKEG